MPKHIGGKKIGSSHSTVTDATEKLVQAARKLPYVTHVVLGQIKTGLPPTQPRLKITQMDAGLRVDVRSATSTQQFTVMTTHKRQVEEDLQMRLKSGNGHAANLR